VRALADPRTWIALAILVSISVAGIVGYRVAASNCAVKIATIERETQERIAQAQAQADAAARSFNSEKQEQQIVYKTIREKAKPIYLRPKYRSAECSLDADALRLFNEANAGKLKHSDRAASAVR
jgi:uncharacterized protein (DUF4415 family)